MLDRDDLRSFVAAARHRTLAVAARHLHLTRSTHGRPLPGLVAGGHGCASVAAGDHVPPLAGEGIRARVERVETEASPTERAVAGCDARFEGPVRVTGSRPPTSRLLAPGFAAPHARHPGLLIEASPDPPGEPLAARDADVRPGRFENQEAGAREIGAIAFDLYGCMAPLARRGEPDPDPGGGCAGYRLTAPPDDRDLWAQAA